MNTPMADREAADVLARFKIDALNPHDGYVSYALDRAIAALRGQAGAGDDRGCAVAWDAVSDVLTELLPDWLHREGSGMECAVAAIRKLATPSAAAALPGNVDAVELDRVLGKFFAEHRYTFTAADKDGLRIALVDALTDLPPKGRHCDEGHTLAWCARDLMEAVNAYHRTTSGNDSRWMDDAARRVAAALAAQGQSELPQPSQPADEKFGKEGCGRCNGEGARILVTSQSGEVIHSAPCPACMVPKGASDDPAEVAYWNFDARRKGYAEWKLAPMSERDAFKAEWRAARPSQPEGREDIGVDGLLTYTGQRHVVSIMADEVHQAVELLRRIQQRAEALDCQSMHPTLAQPAGEVVAWTYERIGDPDDVIVRSVAEMRGNIDMYPNTWRRLRPLTYVDATRSAQGAAQGGGEREESHCPECLSVGCNGECAGGLHGD